MRNGSWWRRKRVADVSVRRAELKDARLIYTWRNLKELVLLSESQREVEWEEHLAWFKNALRDDLQSIYLISEEWKDIGLCRFKRFPEFCEVSVYLVPGYCGKSIGSAALAQCLSLVEGYCPIVLAKVRRDNTRSRNFFLKNGFRETEEPEMHDHLVTFKKIL